VSRPSLFLLGAALAAPALLPAAPGPGGQPDDRELHVVALREGWARTRGEIPDDKIPVRVDRPGKTVTLALATGDSIAWDVSFTPQTRLTQVVLYGSRKQTLSGLPAHIQVVKADADDRNDKLHLPFSYRVGSPWLRPMVRQVHKLTGQEIASFYGAYQYDLNRPIVVSRVQSDPRLRSDYPRPTPAAELPKLQFRASEILFGGPFLQASYGDFTLAGPERQSLRPLPRGVWRLAQISGTKRAYGLSLSEVVDIDLENGTAVKTELGPEVPKMSWLQGITLDTQRDRLYVLADHLYARDRKSGKWMTMIENWPPRFVALTYHPKEDALFALAVSVGGEERSIEEGGTPELCRLNAHGAIIKRTSLGEPLFPGTVGYRPFSTRTQLLAVGDYLVLLTTLEVTPLVHPPALESFLFLIDPKTSKLWLTWKQT
jgi:hypothetical protein